MAKLNATATVTERVAAGAALLDDRLPGWWQATRQRPVVVAELNMVSCIACVLGQLCPDPVLEQAVVVDGLGRRNRYLTQMAALGIHLSRAVEHGLDACDDGTYACAGDEYEALTAAWKQVITGRRTAA